MVLLLAAIMPEPVAAVVAVVARLWMMAGEVIGAGGSLLCGRTHLPDVRHTPAALGEAGVPEGSAVEDGAR